MATLPPLTPMLAFPDPGQAIDWYRKAFAAEDAGVLTDPQGNIVHAELKIAGGLIMLSPENPEYNASPQAVGRTTIVLNVQVDDANAWWERAVQEGARVVFPLKDQFYGHRAGRIEDPFGYQWIISQLIEEVTLEEMQRRMANM